MLARDSSEVTEKHGFHRTGAYPSRLTADPPDPILRRVALQYLPIRDAHEVRAFLARTPLAVDRERFTRFVLGFPHRYLEATPTIEVVKHFALVESLGARSLASCLSREGELFKLAVVAAERRFLFSRIAGSLLAFGANIVAAEAFANTAKLVLDTFVVADLSGRLARPEEGRRLHGFLEGVIAGRIDLDLQVEAPATLQGLALEWDDGAHPNATLLRLRCRDALGLLYVVSRRLSEAGCDIEIAHVETPGGSVADSFCLSAAGRKLSREMKGDVEARLGARPRPDPLGARVGSIR